MLACVGYLCYVKQEHKMAEESVCTSHFLVLADELIDIILSNKFIDHIDLCRFAQICVRCKEIANYSELWKKKALNR